MRPGFLRSSVSDSTFPADVRCDQQYDEERPRIWSRFPSIKKIRTALRCGPNIPKRLSAIGKGLQSVASGMDVAAEAVQRVQQMRDEAVVSDGANQWLQAKDKLLYDPDTGYANTQGRQAVEGFDAYQKSVQGLKRDIVAKMSPAQTGLFNKQVAAYETDALRSGMIKKADETKKWLLQEHTAAAENYSRQAIQTPDDETRWNGFVGRGCRSLMRAAQRKAGASSARSLSARPISATFACSLPCASPRTTRSGPRNTPPITLPTSRHRIT
jgi:hypothetical protein